MTTSTPLRAVALVCTLTPSPARSSSELIAQQVLSALGGHGVRGERLDAELAETDDLGRPLTYGKVAIVAVVGNEDGAHKISADLFQGLNDVGFTIPAGGVTYWNGEAMHTVDYQDLDEVPERVATTTATVAGNAAHLARLLRAERYPAT
jgi:hypothetical protein